MNAILTIHTIRIQKTEKFEQPSHSYRFIEVAVRTSKKNLTRKNLDGWKVEPETSIYCSFFSLYFFIAFVLFFAALFYL